MIRRSSELEEAYQILQVNAMASRQVIKSRYRSLVKKWHPDQFEPESLDQKWATEWMKRINLAYQRIQDTPLQQVIEIPNPSHWNGIHPQPEIRVNERGMPVPKWNRRLDRVILFMWGFLIGLVLLYPLTAGFMIYHPKWQSIPSPLGLHLAGCAIVGCCSMIFGDRFWKLLAFMLGWKPSHS